MSVIAMEVMEAFDHPNADSLRVYKFIAPGQASKERPLQIVANLENVYEVGDVVAVALVGTVLKDETTIKKVNLRGESSYGMALGKVDAKVGENLSDKYEAEEIKPSMAGFIKWPSISGFHNIRKSLEKIKEYEGGAFTYPKLDYKCKVKLHGTNSGVHLHSDGTFAVQSRSRILTPEHDNLGFYRWTQDRKNHFEKWAKSAGRNLTVFGEFCGEGIQKGVAVSKIERKIFVVFAVQVDENTLITDPEEINGYVLEHEDIKVLPWYDANFFIDYSNTDLLRAVIKDINAEVDKVEKEDPWVKEVFGVSGIGEGLVFYPYKEYDRDRISLLMFKAKGEKHQVAVQNKPVQLDPEVLNSINEFSDKFITEARLEQGVAEGCDGKLEMKMMGKFIKWIMSDVNKESKDELEASGLKWKQVGKEVSSRARNWYKQKVEEI